MTAGMKPKAPALHPANYRDKAARPDRVQWLIDNSDTYDALLGAIRDARVSIRVSQLAFDADCVAYGGPPSESSEPAARDGEALLDAILDTSTEYHVNVEIVLNSTLLLDTAAPLRRFLSGSGRNTSRVEVRGISCFPQLLHAKMVIIDDRKAFLVGSPFVNGYWDDPCHAPVDDRRPQRELGGRPLHDVSVAIEGPIVRGLSAIFAELWSAANPGAATNATAVMDSESETKDEAISIVTTFPSRLRGRKDEGSLETVTALLDAIDRAEDLIYIEHQYLSSRPIVAALSGALQRNPSLEIVMVLNQNPDVTAYRGWQNARLAESGLLEHPRVGLYALWSAAPAAEGGVTLNQVFVHSKVVIIDDRWGMVGSANLDGVSMDSYGSDFSWSLPRRIFRGVRNVDVGLIVRENPRGNPIMGSARDLRQRLWNEHLGSTDRIAAKRAEAGWLAQWRNAARDNVEMLNNSATTRVETGSLILPYSVRASPGRQLKDVGISAPVDLRYNPGWLEVHCSPAWVRNIFL